MLVPHVKHNRLQLIQIDPSTFCNRSYLHSAFSPVKSDSTIARFYLHKGFFQAHLTFAQTIKIGFWIVTLELPPSQCGHTFQATRLSSRDSKWKGLSSSKWQNLSSSNWCEIVPMQADVRYWSYPFTSRFPTRATFRQRKPV